MVQIFKMKKDPAKVLLKKIETLKKKNKKIVLCHGVFDLVHLGHLKHFKK